MPRVECDPCGGNQFNADVDFTIKDGKLVYSLNKMWLICSECDSQHPISDFLLSQDKEIADLAGLYIIGIIVVAIIFYKGLKRKE